MAQNVALIDALKNQNVVFVEETTWLLALLTNFAERVEKHLVNPNTFKDLQQFKILESLETEINTARNKPDELIAICKKYESFIRRYSPKFFDRIQEWVGDERQVTDTIHYIDAILRQRDFVFLQKELGRIEASLEKEGHDKKNKERLVARLRGILQLWNESQTLTTCRTDINGWAYTLEKDVSFYSNRLMIFLNGGKLNRTTVRGLVRNFHDRRLEAEVTNDKNVKTMLRMSRYLYLADEQIAFLESLVAFLKEDFDEKTGLWKGKDNNKSTTIAFYNNLERHAGTLRTQYRNELFAAALLKHKKEYGQIPDPWIKLLSGMTALIRQQKPKVSEAIEGLKVSVNQIFEQRQQEIKVYLEKLIAETEIFLQTTFFPQEHARLLEVIKNIILKIRQSIINEMRQRVQQFRKKRQIIRIEEMYLAPKLQRIFEEINIVKQLDSHAQGVKSSHEFYRHSTAVAQRLGQQPNVKNYGLLLMLLFDFKRTEEALLQRAVAKQEIVQKYNSITPEKIEPLKENVRKLIEHYSGILAFIFGMGIEFQFGGNQNGAYVKSKLADYTNRYYGRSN